MKYAAPYGEADADAPYVNGNPRTGTPGSIPPAAALEAPQREIEYVIRQSGQTPDPDNLRQLWAAIQRIRGQRFVEDVGTVANQLIVLPDPAVERYEDGLALLVAARNTITGPSTLRVNNLAAVPILRQNKHQLVDSEIVANGVYLVVYYDGAFQLVGLIDPGSGYVVTQAGLNHYGVDTSTEANLVTVTVPNMNTYAPGTVLQVKINNANTDAVQVRANGLPPRPLVKGAGDALDHYDIRVGVVAWMIDDGTAFQLLNPLSLDGGPGGDPEAPGNDIDYPLAPYWHTVGTASQASPPASPPNGSTFLIPVGAADAWAGLDGQVAQKVASGGYVYRTYPDGTILGVADATGRNRFVTRAAGAWRTAFATDAEAAAGTAAGVFMDPSQVGRAIEAMRGAPFFHAMM